jgi:hypothetical protein
MWAQAVVSVLGIWLLAAPDVLTYSGLARYNNQIIGVWIATFGLIAMSESVRAVRWVNVGLGLWLVLAPFTWKYPHEQFWESLVVGVAVMALACVRGPISGQFGGGWSALWKSPE